MYQNRFDPAKHWHKIQFVPGRSLQAGELNELQAIQDWKLKSFSDLLISDGSPVSGCHLLTPPYYPNIIRVTEGYIYVNGQVIYTDEQDVIGDFSGIDIEWVYVNFTNRIVRETDDSSLKDPALTDTYDLPGAHRRILELHFYNEQEKPTSAIRFDYLIDGKVFFKRQGFGADKIVTAVEVRAYEENGSFLVSGANITLKDNINPLKYSISISNYTGYLQGKRYSTPFPQSITVDKATGVYHTQDVYTISGGGDYSPGTNNSFEIITDYTQQVYTVRYPVRVTLAVVHGTANSIDLFPVGGETAKVLSVTQGATTYVESIDYIVNYTLDGLDWSPLGNEPIPSSVYTVELVYYRIESINIGDTYNVDKFFVTYENVASDDYSKALLIIMDNEYYVADYALIIQYNYTAYQRRIDGVFLNEETGLLKVVKGTQSNTNPIPLPRYSDYDFPLFFIRVAPGDYSKTFSYIIEDKRVVRRTQETLNKIKKDINELESEVIDVYLKQNASEASLVGVSSGKYINALTYIDNSDFSYVGNKVTYLLSFSAVPTVGAFKLKYSLEEVEFTFESTVENIQTELIKFNYFKTVTVTGSFVDGFTIYYEGANPGLECVLYEEGNEKELKDTDDNVVNTTFETSNSFILFPNFFDCSFDDSKLGLPLLVNTNAQDLVESSVNTLKKGKYCWTLPYTEKVFLSQLQATTIINIANNINYGYQLLEINPLSDLIVDVDNVFIVERQYSGASLKIKTEVKSIDSGYSSVAFSPFNLATKLDPVKHVRQNTITISGRSWFVANSVDTYTLRCSIAGVEIEGFGTNITLQEDYSFSGVFTIPEELQTGIIPIRIWTDPIELEATINYTATGGIITNTRSKERVICSPQTIAKKIVGAEVPRKAPLAQSFEINQDIFVSSIELYLSEKDSAYPISLSICELIDGFPSDAYIATSDLQPYSVNTSTNSSTSTKFTFTDPIYLQQKKKYAFVLHTNSSDYKIFTAGLGQDLISESEVLSQPLGTLFKSLNGNVWSIESRTHLKYKINRCEFESFASLEMEPQTINDSWLMILADLAEYKDTTCTIYYNFGITWNRISIGERKQMADVGLASECQIKFDMSTTNSYLSPIINISANSLYWHYDSQGHWYSNVIDFREDNEFNKVIVKLLAIPGGLEFRLKVLASVNKEVWYEFSHITEKIETYNVIENINSYEIEFDLFEHFNGLNLARYLKILVELGYDGFEGGDTSRIWDLRVVPYEGAR